MIYLITGSPGSGKTLYAVSTLVQELAKQKIVKNGVEIKRRVVVDNIRDLVIDHDKMAPGEEVDGSVQPTEDGEGVWNWPDWCKPGDVLVIDEVQRHWRPRGNGVKVKREVAKLETHRHMGIDIVIITQSPMLLDQNVRRLVGNHKHVRRLLGMHRAAIYEWDSCSVNLTFSSASSKSYFGYPKSAYDLYKSSELHTKQKHKIPAFLIVPALGLIGAVFALPAAFGTMSGAMTGKGVSSAANKPASAASAPVQTASSPSPANPASAPIAPGYQAPQLAQLAPQNDIAGCIWSRGRCGCMDVQGKPVEVEMAICEEKAGKDRPPSEIVKGDESPLFAAVPAVARQWSESELDSVRFAFAAKRQGPP